MSFSRRDLRDFIKGILKEKKSSFLLTEDEGPCWLSIMSVLSDLKEKNPVAFVSIVKSLSDAYANHSGTTGHTSDCEPDWGSARSQLYGRGKRFQVDPASIMQPKPESPSLVFEHYDNPVGGVTTRGTPEYLPGEEPINMGTDMVLDDAAAKIIGSVDAVIELNMQEYEGEGHTREDALKMAEDDASATLEIVLSDLRET
jgi:hypothetical protein